MEKIKRRDKLVPFNQLSKKDKGLRIATLSIDVLLATCGLVILILCLTVGDPNNRLMSCIGLIITAFIPLAFELIFQHRLSFFQRILYQSYLFLSSFIGSCLYMFVEFAPFDEIMHFWAGYVICIAVFIIAIKFFRYEDMHFFAMAAIIFMVSLGTAVIWECMEFTVDIFASQSSVGAPPPEVLNHINRLGLTGVKANLYKLQHVSVMDTSTDMYLHLIGSLIFTIQFIIHRVTRKNLLIGSIKKDVLNNRQNKSVDILNKKN